VTNRCCCPPDLRDWLPADHLAWFVIEAIDQLDLEPFYAAYRSDGHGAGAHEPKMMPLDGQSELGQLRYRADGQRNAGRQPVHQICEDTRMLAQSLGDLLVATRRGAERPAESARLSASSSADRRGSQAWADR
jgi:hypothetical protein